MAHQVLEKNSDNSESTSAEQEFAQMNGVELESPAPLPTEQIEPEEIVTTRTVAAHPLLKGLTISGGVLLLVLTFGGMIGTITGTFNSSGSNQKAQENNAARQPLKNEDETGELKTAIALTSQKGELQAMGKKDNEVTPTPIPTTPAPTSSTTSTVSQTPRQVPPQPTPVPRSTRTYQVSSTPSAPSVASRRQYTPTPTTPVATPKPTSNTTSRTSTALPTVRPTAADPMQEWLAVANVGNYSSGDGDAGGSDEESQLENASVNGGTGIKPSGVDNRNQDSPQLPPSNYDGKQVLVGTRASGVMETPIAWVGSGISSNQQQGQNSLIRLSQPLKAFDGSEVLPKGSYIVAILNPTNSEIAQMSAISALVNIDGKTIEKQLPANSILILGKDGNLLKAKSRKGGSNLGNSLMASLLSGLSKAAEIQNRASSETSISSNGVTTTSTSNSDKDLVAGFAEGSINEILSRMKNSNEQQLQSLQQQQQVFVIEAGKQVQIFVNQSISI